MDRLKRMLRQAKGTKNIPQCGKLVYIKGQKTGRKSTFRSLSANVSKKLQIIIWLLLTHKKNVSYNHYCDELITSKFSLIDGEIFFTFTHKAFLVVY